MYKITRAFLSAQPDLTNTRICTLITFIEPKGISSARTGIAVSAFKSKYIYKFRVYYELYLYLLQSFLLLKREDHSGRLALYTLNVTNIDVEIICTADIRNYDETF